MTLLLILVNCAVYFGWQVPEELALDKSATLYARSPLPAIELPMLVTHLRARADASGSTRDRGSADAAQQALKNNAHRYLYTQLWYEPGFRADLLAGRVIKADHPQHEAWRSARAELAAHEPAPFTVRWAHNRDSTAEARPVTWLTATFLHGSTEHLLGNMVFLFLFGFTLELTLGAPLYLLCYLLGGVGASLLWGATGASGIGLGASGAVSALMAMYVVLYRLRRIRFFYMIAFYFNYARWPALVMLPVWVAHELLQQLLSGAPVAYMAHVGGLLAGALLMGGLLLVRRYDAPEPDAALQAADPRAVAQQAELRQLTTRATDLAQQLRFADAAAVWEKAARLAPRDVSLLQAWFDCARHAPASDGFHTAARLIFKLPARDAATRTLQHQAYQCYLQQAKPGVRLSADTMQRLVRSFAAEGHFRDAEALATSLARMQSPPEGWPATLEQLVSGLAKAGKPQAARAWLPELQRTAPDSALARWLAQQPES